MNSPFEIFRKHQKAAMVILVFMAMFAFIVLDSIQKISTNLTTPLIGLALGTLLAGVFWFIGNQKGQGKEYAVLGLVIGVAAAVIGQQMNRPAAAFYSTAGNMSEREFREAIYRRNAVNQFLDRAHRKIAQRYLKQHPNAKEHEVPRMSPGFKFGLFYNPDFEQRLTEQELVRDVGYAFVFRREAEKMGITVSDEAITDYIRRATKEQLSAADFKAALKDTGLGETQLYDMMRDELKARLAVDCLRPRAFPVPDDYWQLYRRMNVRQELDVAAVPVKMFVSEVAEPSDGELMPFFEQHKKNAASREVTADPAFGQPRKVQIAYVKAGVESFEGAISKTLDQEIAEAEAAKKPTPIEEYYETNKDRYRNPTFPADQKKPGPKLSAPDLPEGEKPEGEKKDAEKKADDKKPDDAKPEGDKKPEADKPGEKKPEGDKPGEEKKPDAEKKPADDKPAAKPDEKNPGSGDEDEEQDDAAQADTKAAETKPAAEPGDKKPDDKKPDDKKSEEKKADDKDAPAKKDEDKKDGDAKEGDKKDGEKPDAEKKEGAKEDPLLEFQPLDDKLKEEIRRQIINDRVGKQLDAKIERANAHMTGRADAIREQQFEAAAQAAKKKQKTVDEVDHDAISKDLQTWAEENGFRYGVTELVSFQELMNSDDNPIGVAVEALADPRSARPVAMAAFQSDPKQTYFPTTAVDRITGNRYCWWKITDRPAYIPELTDKGMREKVVAAWKLVQAREPAEKRAEQLAELVRAAEGKPITEALAGQTVTGKPETPAVTVSETEPFSWIRRASASASNPFASPPPELSTISAIDNVDEAFMETIFLKMKTGETKAVPNADKSVYYVVRVKNRTPSTDEGEAELRQRFLADRAEFFPDADRFMRMFRRSPYVQMLEQEQYALFQKWQVDLQKKYLLEWNLRGRGSRDAEE